MKITRIEKQKKNSERYSLYVDDEFWMGVNEAVLVKFALFKAQTVTAKDLNEIAEVEYQHSIYSQAIKFLAHGLKTVKETRDYLTKYLADRHKEQEEQPHPNEALYIEQAIEKLTEQKYLNDLFYSQSYVRTHANLNQKGPALLRRELQQKGVAVNIIEEAMQEYPAELAVENAQALADKYARIKKQYPPKKLIEKTRQMLHNKGYNHDLIQQVIHEVDLSASAERQDDLLAKEAEKQLRKWRRKHSGFQLKQKMTESMMRKGFDYDLIKTWMAEHEEAFIEE